MGTIKADTLTGLSSSAEVTIVSNKFTGTASGNITLPGEGGTTTTNLQQGLCKSWAHTTQASSYVIDDSFNVSSHDADGTGDGGINFSNNMANQGYSSTTGVRSDIGSFLSNSEFITKSGNKVIPLLFATI